MEATNQSRRLMLRRDADAGDPPKLPGALQLIADHLRPAFFTTAPGMRPDIGRGMGDARDRGLDAAARDATNVRPLAVEAPSPSETRTAAS